LKRIKLAAEGISVQVHTEKSRILTDYEMTLFCGGEYTPEK
jgi:hypothetical protein